MALNDAQMQQFMAAQQAQVREQVLYQFACGTMEMSPNKLVSPDRRKGKLVITMEDDGLLRVQWRLRHSDENEQQYFIFPGGASFSQVAECKDGVVFLLKMNDSNVRRFFWLQEAKTGGKKAADILKRVSSLIANPPQFGAPIPPEETADADAAMADVPSVSVASHASGPLAAVQGTGHTAVTNPAAESARGVVAQPPPASATATAAPTSGAAPAASGAPAAASSAATPLNANALMTTLNAMAQQLAQRQQDRAGVEDVLDAERVQPILDVDSALIDALVEYLPEGQRSPEALRQQLRSPQMQQTMSRLTQILNSSQFGQLMASLSLPVGAQSGIGVDGFIAAIQQQAAKQQEQGKGAEKK